MTQTVTLAAFLLGAIFGFVGNKTNFCTMGAVSDIVNMGDWNRMRMWLLAIAIAILGANGLSAAGIIDLSKSIYTGDTLTWLSAIVGGLAFGFGMVLASGCGSKTLIRIGSGNLKSLVAALVLGIAAYMTLKGLFGVWRVNFLDPASVALGSGQDLPSLLAKATGMAKASLQIGVSLTVAAALLFFVFKSRDFINGDNLLGGIVIGLTVVAGWYVSGKLGFVAEHPKTLEAAWLATNTGRIESLSFVAPTAYALELLMFWSDTSKGITFGIAAALGMVFGSLVYALVSKSFRWEGFRDAEDTGNHLVGGALMGFGGVTALGCTVGQGVTGLSTLAIGSLLAFAAILGGAVLGLKYQIWRVERIA